jgi:hypothetical protein
MAATSLRRELRQNAPPRREPDGTIALCVDTELPLSMIRTP